MSTPVHQLSPQQKLFSQNGGITIMNVLLINGSPHAHGYADKPHYRPLTKFENRGLRLGHGVWDLVFVRKPLD